MSIIIKYIYGAFFICREWSREKKNAHMPRDRNGYICKLCFFDDINVPRHICCQIFALILVLHFKKWFGPKPIYIKAVISYNILFAPFLENKNLTPWVTQFLCYDTEVPTAFQFRQKWKSPLCFCRQHCWRLLLAT